MKHLRLIASTAFVLAGSALLPAPSYGASFAPTRFTVTDEGTVGKPDVVLIPGLASSTAVWAAEVKLLAPNYRLHLVQVDGFAGSPAGPNASGPVLVPIVAELHEYIVGAKMHPMVVGHSLGGLLALMLADKHPEDLKKIVIVDSLPSLGGLYNPKGTPAMFQAMAEANKAQMLDSTPEEFAQAETMTVNTMVNDEEGKKAAVQASMASDRVVVADAMADDMETDLRAAVVRIKVPVLVMYPYDAKLQGSDPAKVDALYGEQYKPMPNVKLLRVDNSRHYIMYDQPAKFDAALESFLQ